MTCVFCTLDQEDTVADFEYFVAILDKFPVSTGHVLVISKSHKKDFFELDHGERRGLLEAVDQMKNWLLAHYEDIDGFNIGMNVGLAAGQSVMHFHLHLIPRRNGDTENPKGGVRGVIPHKMNY